MDVAFDHVVIVVPELAPAVRAFSEAGFTVQVGGRHDVLPTENALIAFEDGAYLELLAPRDADARDSLRVRSARPGWPADVRRAPAIARRFLPNLVGPPGVADYVLGSGTLAMVASSLRRLGLAATGPVPMTRRRPDGARLEWELLLPAEPWLPFFIRDMTPRSLRVPDDAASRWHANGARGVAEVRVRVSEIAAVALQCADLFGASPRVQRDGTTCLEIGGVRVVLEQGTPVGARGVALRGVGTLPAGVEALGVRVFD